MCSRCDGFAERLNFASLRDYLDIVRQLIEVVSEGTFRILRADCPLRDMFNTPMPGDTVFHEFACTNCDQRFTLFADTYHGNASWTPD